MHPSAVIDSRAELAGSVEIGPGVVIGPRVKIGANTVIGPHAVIESDTTIGARNHIYQFASIGAEPQDLKFKGEPSVVEIGDDNLIREFSTIHRGTEGGGMVTRIGSHVLVMNYVHVAHDCIIGDYCILANSTELAGHIVFEDHVRAMGGVLIQQFTRMGAYSMLAAGARIEFDVPPFAIASGDRARLVGVHEIGLQRAGFDADKINLIKSAMRKLFFSKLTREEAVKEVAAEFCGIPEVEQLLSFIRNSRRGVIARERD
ncbi:MAG TPA: acyl-ACP--UDP-N-acetylglucosamine O-acyltransferase [Candidatus Binataceae bacterium]|nr:acyl-ACP--UDP-N-acetylglucosamine O-acyltransferase [Candidatus Binataceae bacterium]